MPSSHSEITAYINEGDIARIATALTALCAGEGMRVAAQPHSTCVRQILEPSDGWTFALLPGAPGWTVVEAQPWNVLCEPSTTGPMRFVDLCTTLGVRGFMIDVVSVGPHGAMLVETDGHGLRRLSGWYDDGGSSGLMYYGTPLEHEDFTGFSTFEVCAELDCAQSLAKAPGILGLDECSAIAHDVGGVNGERFWTSGEDFSGAWDTIQQAMRVGGPLPVLGGALLEFQTEQPSLRDSAPRVRVSEIDVRALGHECEALGEHAKAAACYRRAVDMGDPESASLLAAMYREGRGVPQDVAESQALSALVAPLRERREAEIERFRRGR